MITDKIAVFVHDTYFYWMHRLMHHRRLFRWFHRVHHESMNPSPWAAYSFGPLPRGDGPGCARDAP